MNAENHFEITYIKPVNIPPSKFDHWYAILSIEGHPSVVPFTLSSLDKQQTLTPFLSKPPVTLEIKLFAKYKSLKWKPHLLIAQRKVQLDSVGETEVSLTPTADYDLKKNSSSPTLVFNVAMPERFTVPMIAVDAASLEVDPRLTKALDIIRRIVTVGMVFSQLNPIANAVMSLVNVGVSEFNALLKRNDSVLQLVEEIVQANTLVIDWEDAALVELRPNQERVCQELLPEMHDCLNLLLGLSAKNLTKRLSEESIAQVDTHRKKLMALVKCLESNQHLDTQAAVFQTKTTVTETRAAVSRIYDDHILRKLHVAKGAGPAGSKACLEGTRVALLKQIHDWALDFMSPRSLLLSGAAGKGKSAIAHTVALQLEKSGEAIVPFFAFNRSVQDRSSSQLIPTWMKHLAEHNSKYLNYLQGLTDEQLSSVDIVDQLQVLLLDGLSKIDEEQPIIFIVDALDECSEAEAGTLSVLLQNLLSSSQVLSYVHFLFTYRLDPHILGSFIDVPALKISIDDDKDTLNDVHKFVTSKLAKPAVAYMVNDVVTASQGLFQCAALLCSELTTSRKLSSSSSRFTFLQHLKEAPGTPLYQSYLLILNMYIDKDDNALVMLFQRLMAWIFLVQSPQSCQVFYKFAAVLLSNDEQDDIKNILSCLGSMLNGSTVHDKAITPFHTSLRDFLVTSTECGVYQIDLGSHFQEELALACLKIMNAELHFNMCKLPTSFLLNSEIKDLSQQVNDNLSCGLLYANKHATYHLQRSTPQGLCQLVPEIAQELKVFLKNKYLFWLEAHSCMQTHQNGPGTLLPHFLHWAKYKENKYEELADILEDYMKFEKRFRQGYQLSAPQVYYSGLCFAPKNSIVATTYESQFENLITIVKGRDVIWPPSEPLVCHLTSGVIEVAFSPDGKYIVSGSDDNIIRIWDSTTGQQIGNALTGHEDSVQSVAFSPDGKHIVSGSCDNTIRIWDLATGQQIGDALIGHENRVQSVIFSPDGKHIVSGSSDKTIRIWDLAAGQQVGDALIGHKNWVQSVAFSPDGKHIVSGSYDKTIRIWNMATRKQIVNALTGHNNVVTSVAFSPEGKHIVSGSNDYTIRIWDSVTGQQIGDALTGHEDFVKSVAFSSDCKHIMSGSYDYTIRIWDSATGQQVGDPLIGHEHWVESVAFSPDGKQVVSGSHDETIRIWDSATGQQIGDALTGHTNWVHSVEFSPDSKHIVSGSHDKTVRIWDSATGQQVGDALIGHKNVVASVAFSPDSKHIISGSHDKTIRIWDSTTGQQVGDALTGHKNWVRSVVFSPNGKHIVSGSDDRTIRIWDSATGQQVGDALIGHKNVVTSVGFSPDGKHIVSGSYDCTIRIWESATGQQVGDPLTGHEHWVESVAFSLDGKHIVSGSDDKTIRIWDSATRQQVGDAFTEHENLIKTVAFSPDNKHIVSGSHDNTIRIWNWHAIRGKQVGSAFTGHQNYVKSIAFPPDALVRTFGSQCSIINHELSWFCLDNNVPSALLWIPHTFQHCHFVWNTPHVVISSQKTLFLQFAAAVWGTDWIKIYKEPI